MGADVVPTAGMGALSLSPAATAALPPPARVPGAHPETDDDEEEDEEDETRLAPGASSLSAPGADLQHETTVKAGYLYKRGEKRRTWKKRWFVLRSSRLAYYKNDKEYQLLRLIDLSDVHTVTAVELKRSQNGFGIVTPKRTFYIKAQDQVDMRDWITKLNQVRRALSDPSAEEGFRPEGYHDGPFLQQHPSSPPDASASTKGEGGFGSSPGRPDHNPWRAGAPAPPAQGTYGRSPVTSDSEASGAGGQSRSRQDASPGLGPSHKFAHHGELLAPNMPLAAGQAVLSSSDDDWNEEEGPGGQALAHPLPGGPYRPPDPISASPETSARSAQAVNAEANAAFLRDPSRVLLQGYLLKQSARRKAWRKRWFVLTSSQLLWAGSHMDTRTNRRLTVNDMVDAIEYEPSSSSSATGQGGGSGSGPLSISTRTHPPRSRDLLGSSAQMLSPGGSSTGGTSLFHPASPTGETDYVAPAPAHSTLGFLERRSSIMNGISQGAASAIGVGGHRKRQEHCFRVITPKRTLLLCAPSEEEEIKWLSTLQTLISRVRDARAQEHQPH